MAIDRVSRKKNREQDARLDALAEAAVYLDGRIDKLENPTPPPPPEPEPEPGLQTLFAPKSSRDWNSRLIEKYTATITDPAPGNTRFRIEGPADLDGGRCEVQAHGSNALPSQGGFGFYLWSLMIPSGIQLSSQHSQGFNTVAQFHGDNNPGYTGGLAVVYGTEIIVLRITGGIKGRYEERVIPFGQIERDKIHNISIQAKWASDRTGSMLASLDSGEPKGADGVPTSSNVSDHQMWRLGWYPRDVRATGLTLNTYNPRLLIPR